MTAGAEREERPGVVFLTPLSEALRRRLTAGAMALAINTLIVTGLIFMPRPDAIPPEPDVLDIVFVTDPVIEPEPELEPEPERPETPDPEPTPQDATAPVAEPEVSPEPVSPPAAEPVDGAIPAPAGGEEAPNILSDTDPFNDNRAALPFPGGGQGTEYAVRSVFCLSTSTANREALACPLSDGSEGLPMLQFASEENLARARAAFVQSGDLDAEEIRSLFGVRTPHPDAIVRNGVLSSQGGLATSSSDQMRDTLPE